MPVFVFFILLTSTTMLLARDDGSSHAMTKAKTTMVVREHEHQYMTRRRRIERGAKPHQYQWSELKKLVFFRCCNDEQQLFFVFCLKETTIITSSWLALYGPVSCAYHQGRVSKHISDVKIYGFRSFSILFLSLLLFNDWPFSLPLTRYCCCCTRRIRFERCSGLLVAYQFASWAIVAAYELLCLTALTLEAPFNKSKKETGTTGDHFFYEMQSW